MATFRWRESSFAIGWKLRQFERSLPWSAACRFAAFQEPFPGEEALEHHCDRRSLGGELYPLLAIWLSSNIWPASSLAQTGVARRILSLRPAAAGQIGMHDVSHDTMSKAHRPPPKKNRFPTPSGRLFIDFPPETLVLYTLNWRRLIRRPSKTAAAPFSRPLAERTRSRGGGNSFRRKRQVVVTSRLWLYSQGHKNSGVEIVPSQRRGQISHEEQRESKGKAEGVCRLPI